MAITAKQVMPVILGKTLTLRVDDGHGLTILSGEELVALNMLLTEYTKVFNSNTMGLKGLTLLTCF